MHGDGVEDKFLKDLLAMAVVPHPFLLKARRRLSNMDEFRGVLESHGMAGVINSYTNVAFAVLIHLGQIKTIGEFREIMLGIEDRAPGEFDEMIMARAMEAIEAVTTGDRNQAAGEHLSAEDCEHLLGLHAGFAHARAVIARMGDQFDDTACTTADVQDCLRVIDAIESVVGVALMSPTPADVERYQG